MTSRSGYPKKPQNTNILKPVRESPLFYSRCPCLDVVHSRLQRSRRRIGPFLDKKVQTSAGPKIASASSAIAAFLSNALGQFSTHDIVSAVARVGWKRFREYCCNWRDGRSADQSGFLCGRKRIGHKKSRFGATYCDDIFACSPLGCYRFALCDVWGMWCMWRSESGETGNLNGAGNGGPRAEKAVPPLGKSQRFGMILCLYLRLWLSVGLVAPQFHPAHDLDFESIVACRLSFPGGPEFWVSRILRPLNVWMGMEGEVAWFLENSRDDFALFSGNRYGAWMAV
jgi:hypothetical protein